MKISGYYIYNNVAITAFTVMAILRNSPKIPLSKVTLLMPILLDDNIINKMISRNYANFDSVITQNKVYLSNFNNRYVDLLPQVVNAISILLDLNLVSLYGEYVISENAEKYESILARCDSNRLKNICIVSPKLLKLVKDSDIVNDYRKLNIEL